MTNQTAVRVNGLTPWRTLDGEIIEVVVNPGLSVRDQYKAACRVARLPREKRPVERTLAGLSKTFYDSYAYKGSRPTRSGTLPWLVDELKRHERRRVLFTAKPKMYVRVRRYSPTDALLIYGYLVGVNELLDALETADLLDDSDQILTSLEAMDLYDCYELRQLARHEEPNGR